MATFTDEYIRSLKDSELKMLIPEKLEERMASIQALSADEKNELFNAMRAFIEHSIKQQSKSRGWFRSSNPKSKYSIVQSDSADEILANGFKSAIRCLGKEYYDQVQKSASEAYIKNIRRKKTPAMWMLQFLAPIVKLKDKLFKKKAE